MAFETILFEVRNQIAWVTMNRPESMNAINRLMARELVVLPACLSQGGMRGGGFGELSALSSLCRFW